MKVLVTGGSGYIGSHTCVQLLQQGHEVVILDNLCNSKRSVLPVIERLGGKEATFIEGDIRNEALMTEILHDHAIEAVIHFAGLKAVGESVAKPLEYYDNNVTGTLKLVSAMRAAGVKNFIFSSAVGTYQSYRMRVRTVRSTDDPGGRSNPVRHPATGAGRWPGGRNGGDRLLQCRSHHSRDVMLTPLTLRA